MVDAVGRDALRNLDVALRYITKLRAGVELLASLCHTQHHTHPQASRQGWEHCSLAECVAARKVLAQKSDA